MIFGFDFDNTLINYDKIFYNHAIKKKFISKNVKKNKKSIKEYLIKKKNFLEWKKLQSRVYSQEINKAKPNKELIVILKLLKKKNITFYIVSHKTKYPYYGKKKNLHMISKKWLNNNIFNKKNNLGRGKYFFETTIKKKINRIKKLKITHFIDDLKEIIDLIPDAVVKILYKKNSFKPSIVKRIINKELKI
jgi:hypothetical protein